MIQNEKCGWEHQWEEYWFGVPVCGMRGGIVISEGFSEIGYARTWIVTKNKASRELRRWAAGIWLFLWKHIPDFGPWASLGRRIAQSGKGSILNRQRRVDSRASIHSYSMTSDANFFECVLTSVYHLDIGRECVMANQFRCTSKSVDRLVKSRVSIASAK
jgi:hypothetical protein